MNIIKRSRNELIIIFDTPEEYASKGIKLIKNYREIVDTQEFLKGNLKVKYIRRKRKTS